MTLKAKRNRKVRPIFILGAGMLIIASALSACSRAKYRLAADSEAYCLISEKNSDARWTVPRYGIEIDPRSRYHEEYRQDCPPMPMDDPASHRFMHCVDSKKGWPYWHNNGTRPELENSAWRDALGQYVETTKDGAIKLDLDSAIRLAYVHSPNHQTQLETLYLSALDVSRERFRLDTQFFGGTSGNYRHSGDLSPAGIGLIGAGTYGVTGPFVGEESNRLTLGRGIGDPTLQARRTFATAGELLVGFANSFVVEFTGPNAGLHSSIANFALTQPLLRGAGRDIALEQLTFFERTLLANLRAYAQFRQGFYTQVAIGEAGVVGPARNGRGTSLQIFGGQAGTGGYVGLLQTLQRIRNAEDNLDLQVRTLEQLEALLEAGLIDLVQVDQFRQNVESDRANLLQQKNAYQTQLDQYKVFTLGLPPDLQIELDDELIKQFQIVAREATSLQNSIRELQDLLGLLSSGDTADAIREPTAAEVQLALKDVIPATQALMEPIEQQLKDTEADIDRMDEAVAAREKSMDDEKKEEFADDRQQLRENLEEQFRRFEAAKKRLAGIEASIAGLLDEESPSKEEPDSKLDASETGSQTKDDTSNVDDASPSDNSREDSTSTLQDETQQAESKGPFLDALAPKEKSKDEIAKEETVVLLRDLVRLMQGAILIQGRARLEAVTVDSINVESEYAFRIALDNRLDFMNGRAALVDDWRTIQVAADALQASLDVTVNGNMRTARNNPVSFDPQTSSLNLGLRFDAPFTRLLERNTYRESLINYQRSRRAFIQSRDSLHLGLRVLLREVDRLRQSLEIQRRAVRIAIRRVDVTRAALYAPVAPPQPGRRAPPFGPTATINLLSAQAALRDTQNNFLGVWLSYYSAKMRLYRELGIMSLGPEGEWIETALPSQRDPNESLYPIDPSREGLIEEVEEVPPPVPNELLNVVEALPEGFTFDFVPPNGSPTVPVVSSNPIQLK